MQHRIPLLSLLLASAAVAIDPVGEGELPRRDQRIRVLRFQPGFLADPVNLFPETPTPAELDLPPEPGGDWLNVWMGNDNPFTDFRRPGSGGVGFYRVVGQMQLIDSASTSFALNLEAVTPAGRAMDGVENGPTFFTPTIAVYHELANGVALHGFIGTQVGVQPTTALPTRRPVECGLAYQHPLFLPDAWEEDGLYLTLGALGRWGEPATLPGRLPGLEVQPGLHWQLDNRTWLSGALIVPVQRGPRPEVTLWQLTCQVQF